MDTLERGNSREVSDGQAPVQHLRFMPNSRHQPRSETGVRLFWINLRPRET